MREWESFTNQQQWKDYIINLLKTDNKALARAVIHIYENQTEEEKLRGRSIDHNHVGFSQVDGEFLTQIALKLKNHQPVTLKEVAITRNKMIKYWKQLMTISKRRMKEKCLKD